MMDIKRTSTIIWCPNLTKGQKIRLHLIHKCILLINLMLTAKKTFMKIIFITLDQPRIMKSYTHICMSKLSYIIGHQIYEKLNISSPLGMECNNQWQPSNNHNDYLTKNISCHYPKMLGFEMILIFLFFLLLSKQDEDRMVHYTKRITVVREKI